MRRQVKAPDGLRPGQLTGSVTRKAGVLVEVGQYHAHGCTVCGRRYSDSCGDQHGDGQCQEHRENANTRPIWESYHDPVACCREQSQVCTRDEIIRYSLGGSVTWFKCRSCARTIPYDPTTTVRTTTEETP